MFSTDVYFDIKSWNIYRDVIYLIIIIFTSTVKTGDNYHQTDKRSENFEK